MRIALLATKSMGVEALKVCDRLGEVVCVIGDEKVRDAARETTYGGVYRMDDVVPVRSRLQYHTPDVTVAAHWTKKVGQSSRQVGLGVIGIHPSLLPRWRGIAAVEWQAAYRDAIVGSTAYWMDDGLDTGPIICQQWAFADPSWDASALWRECLFGLNLAVLTEALSAVRLGRGRIGHKQDERFATLAPKPSELGGLVRTDAEIVLRSEALK
jgi:methionyl-tRNA formyltransferase